MEHIILDVDLAMGAPGSDIDDGFALALALADPDITVDLVTTVNGNTDVDSATTLTLELLDRLGHPEVPVHRGARFPLLRPRARTGSVPDGTPERAPASEAAAMAMVEHVRAHPGEITLVAVGPLTNVALAMRLDSEFATHLKALVIMGGVFAETTGNVRMAGEFNIWCDPEAARIVLDSPIAARWVGLDVTLKVRVTRQQSEQMAASDKPFTSFAGTYTTAWIDHLLSRQEFHGDLDDPSCAMHDPLAVAAVTHPDLLTWRDAHVEVSTTDPTRGVMIADHHLDGTGPDGSPKPAEPNAVIAVAVDADGFNRHFVDNLETLS